MGAGRGVGVGAANRLMQLGPTEAHEFYRDFLVWYARYARPIYLEIGCAEGRTCWMMYEHCQYIDAVDVQEYGSWAEHKDKFPNLHFYCTTSDGFFKYWAPKDDPYNLIFIDGDHSEIQVLKDVYNALCVLAPQGLIALHDTYPPNEDHTGQAACGTAYKAVDRLLQESLNLELQIYTFPVMFGLTLLSRKLVLPWVQ